MAANQQCGSSLAKSGVIGSLQQRQRLALALASAGGGSAARWASMAIISQHIMLAAKRSCSVSKAA